MAYNAKNQNKFIRKVIAVYMLYKAEGIPDTQIVNKRFPEHDIHISYRTWMKYKGLNPSQYNL